MSRHQILPRNAAFAAGALATVLAMPAPAQVLGEIIVTAQKKEQAMQDVGITMNAFTGDQLKSLNVEQSIDIAKFSPGVHLSGALAGQNTQFTIRGVTQTDFNDIVEAPNAVYLDEGYIPIAQAQTFGLFDIERVEILKGPQSTLFGRNATGGLVQYISRKPTFDRTEGYADVSYGLFDVSGDPNFVRLEAAVGGPLSDKVAGRVAFMHNNQDPYLINRYDPNDQFAFGAATIGAGLANDPGPGSGADMGDDETTAARHPAVRAAIRPALHVLRQLVRDRRRHRTLPGQAGDGGLRRQQPGPGRAALHRRAHKRHQHAAQRQPAQHLRRRLGLRFRPGQRRLPGRLRQ